MKRCDSVDTLKTNMTDSTAVNTSTSDPGTVVKVGVATEESTTATVSEDSPENNESSTADNSTTPNALPIVSSSKKSRPPYKYDPSKITLRFLFANRDGLTVTVECKPADTVGEVKGALLSVWPKDLPSCSGGDRLRLICMGKGVLMPDTRTLEDCQVPIFKTHPTPINVSVRPEVDEAGIPKTVGETKTGRVSTTSAAASGSPASRTVPGAGVSAPGTVDQGCSCIIL